MIFISALSLIYYAYMLRDDIKKKAVQKSHVYHLC